jgi:hypothetical protein
MIVLALILVILSGIAEAVIDTLNFHYYDSIFRSMNQFWWNPEWSWMNKYSDVKSMSPRFFGSVTFLVWTTDAWHLFKSIRSSALWTGSCLAGAWCSSYHWSVFIGMIVAIVLLNRLVFELFYSKVFRS